MKRDMDLVRKILKAVEDSPTGRAPRSIQVDGHDGVAIGYHSLLMIQAGLANGSEVTNGKSPGPCGSLTSLTWEGHEFLEAARDDTRWSKAKALIEEKGGALTLDVFKEVLKAIAKGAIALV